MCAHYLLGTAFTVACLTWRTYFHTTPPQGLPPGLAQTLGCTAWGSSYCSERLESRECRQLARPFSACVPVRESQGRLLLSFNKHYSHSFYDKTRTCIHFSVWLIIPSPAPRPLVLLRSFGKACPPPMVVGIASIVDLGTWATAPEVLPCCDGGGAAFWDGAGEPCWLLVA